MKWTKVCKADSDFCPEVAGNDDFVFIRNGTEHYVVLTREEWKNFKSGIISGELNHI